MSDSWVPLVPGPAGAAAGDAPVALAIGVGLLSAATWAILWGIGELVLNFGTAVFSVLVQLLCGQHFEPHKPSGWYRLGHYGQWAYGAVSLALIVAVLTKARHLLVIGGLWFATALLMAAASYMAFEVSMVWPVLGAASVGTLWWWLAHRRSRGAA